MAREGTNGAREEPGDRDYDFPIELLRFDGRVMVGVQTSSVVIPVVNRNEKSKRFGTAPTK